MATSSTYNGKTKDLRYINIDAAPGNPSTFWVSESDKYYRTYEEAKQDAGLTNVNPEDYVIKKSFFTQHKKTILICAIVLVCGLIVIYLFDKNKLIYGGKPW
jgi:hypothetical protein